MRKLPPLGAVRAFEAAARHMSFTKAAAELYVTQAAISHQVRQLEAWLGQQLFERKGHKVTITSTGKAYLGALSGIFDQLAIATEQARAPAQGPLRITVLPSFASCWLLPRLPNFHHSHPGIELRISSSLQQWPGDGEFDAGIRSGLGKWPGLKAELLAHEYLSPLCSPVVASELTKPGDLASLRLLHDKPRSHWAEWCDQTQIQFDVSQGLFFDDASLVLQAARESQGIALGRLLLAQRDIEEGRLVQPFTATLQNDFSYWIVTPKTAIPNPQLDTFRTWLKEKVSCGR